MNKTILKYFLFGVFFHLGINAFAQTGISQEATDSLLFFNNGSRSMTIGEDGRVRIGGNQFLSTSTLLELNGSGLGLLVPRVTSAAAILDPKPGMIAYNTTTNKYISYTASGGWSILLNSDSNYPVKIEDADADTKVLVVSGGNDNDSIVFITAGTDRMMIDKNGYVGIGTSVPDYKMHVVSDGQFISSFEGNNADFSVLNVKGNISSAITGYTAIVGTDTVIFAVDPVSETMVLSYDKPGGHFSIEVDTIYKQGSNGGTIYNRTYGTSQVDTTYTERLYVLENPNSPGSVLTNTGGGRAEWQTPTVGVEIADADNDTKVEVEQTTDMDAIIFSTSGAERMGINSTGDVGINTDNPFGKLHVSTDDDNVGGIAIQTASTTGAEEPYLFFVKSRGNSTTPSAVGSGDRLGGVSFNSYDGSDFGDAAAIYARTTQAHTPTKKGTDLVFKTTPFDASTGNESMVISDNGNVGIGVTVPEEKLHLENGVFMMTSVTAPGTTTDRLYNSGGDLFWDGVQLNSSSPSWSLTGNSGTVDGTNFIGNSDDVALTMRTNNRQSARLESDNLLGNTFFGYENGVAITSGGYNTANGLQAMFANTSGNENAAFGAQTLYANTTGNSNTAIGNYALYNSTTGHYNTALGRAALYSNTEGGSNTALGRDAMYTNVAGNNGTAVGYSAMRYTNSTVTAYTNYNTAVGYEALRGSTDAASNLGNFNTVVGYQALMNNTSGGSNTVLGYAAGLANDIGASNTFIGQRAGYSNTDGAFNTFLGRTTGYSNTTGDFNTFLGGNAGYSNTGGLRNVFIGYNAGYNETGSDKLYIENSNTGTPLIGGDFASDEVYINGDVGIGTSSPGYMLDVQGTSSSLISYAIGANGTAYTPSGSSKSPVIGVAGALVGVSNTSSLDNGAAYYAFKVKNALTTEQNAYIGAISTSGAGNSPSIVFGQQTGSSSYNETMRIDPSGNVGIGTASPARALDVNGVLRLEPLGAVPSSPQLGDIYTDGGDGMLYYYNSSSWVNLSTGDNLGNHTATSNIILGANRISNDGDNEGISVAANGQTTFTPAVTGAGSKAVQVNGDIWTSGLGTGLYFTNSGLGITGNNGNAGSMHFYTGSAERMEILSGGDVVVNTRVGIGTNPTEKLQVAGRVLLGQTTAPGTTTDKLYNVGGNLFWNGTQLGVSDNLGNHTATSNIILGSNYLSGDGGNEGVFVDASGNIGIGTNNPTLKINHQIATTTVNKSTLQIYGGSSTSSLSTIALGGGTTTDGDEVGVVDFINYNNGGYNMARISANKGVGGLAEGELRFYTRSGSNLTQRMVIDNAGDVGIGVTAPTEALEIRGNIKLNQASDEIHRGTEAVDHLPKAYAVFSNNGTKQTNASTGNIALDAHTANSGEYVLIYSGTGTFSGIGEAMIQVSVYDDQTGGGNPYFITHRVTGTKEITVNTFDQSGSPADIGFSVLLYLK